LIFRQGSTLKVLENLVEETQATGIFFHRRYEPAAMERDKKIVEHFSKKGIVVKSFNGSLLFKPGGIQNRQGAPFKVFTPFYKTCLKQGEIPTPLSSPQKISSPSLFPSSLPLSELQLEPTIDWAQEIRESWKPGSEGAYLELERFLNYGLEAYLEERDRPDFLGTSRLSPHLHFGEISPRLVWYMVQQYVSHAASPGLLKQAEGYLRQLLWREFSYHLLYHFPQTPKQPLRPEFSKFPWQKDSPSLQAWQKGLTGYPIVDAGMRELWATGWMHNRVRMMVASFLVKDLLIPWQEGAEWFWDTLVDADLANNTFGWQWAAGCGADAAPYFRIFNPVTQAEKFDPKGEYIKRWIPELSNLPPPWIFKPWAASTMVLQKAKVHIGENYPTPIVDHTEARRHALAAFQKIKKK
jgi:deoxyribodipyrimidine photo-lyase